MKPRIMLGMKSSSGNSLANLRWLFSQLSQKNLLFIRVIHSLGIFLRVCVINSRWYLRNYSLSLCSFNFVFHVLSTRTHGIRSGTEKFSTRPSSALKLGIHEHVLGVMNNILDRTDSVRFRDTTYCWNWTSSDSPLICNAPIKWFTTKRIGILTWIGKTTVSHRSRRYSNINLGTARSVSGWLHLYRTATCTTIWSDVQPSNVD